MKNKIRVCVIGLGYVGLPLSIELSKKYETVAYDISSKRIQNLKNAVDINKEISQIQLRKSKIRFTNSLSEISKSNYYIVAVPTPINNNKKPKLANLKNACLAISKILKKGDIVIFESTVYPGLTEEYCVPLLEKNNNYKLNRDYYCGYSPERINPGDKVHNIKNIIKITSGSNKYSANKIDKLYKSIIQAGTYKVDSIKIAEAAKVIENTQRDLNIAFVNELSIIFDKLGINTYDVLKAASTKWNFLKFYPGLVGGHCIGVDPYYLTFKSKLVGYNPKVILSGRKINDNMSKIVFEKINKYLIKSKIPVNNRKVLILGATFKENCADTRNSQVFEILKLFKKNRIKFDVYDPWVNKLDKYNNNFIKKIDKSNYYNAVIVTVGHNEFLKMGYRKINKFLKKNSLFFDLKNIFKIKKNKFYKTL